MIKVRPAGAIASNKTGTLRVKLERALAAGRCGATRPRARSSSRRSRRGWRLAEDFGADCIFTGATWYNGRVERSLPGSVSAAVAACAHCSVEVVRG